MNSTQKAAADQSQKLMIFVLSMSLFGLASLFTELIPHFQAGIVEFSVEYFLFIPLTLAMLFDPGCAIGFICAIAAEFLAETGFELIDWEAEWAESTTALSIGMIVAAAAAVIVLAVMKKYAQEQEAAA